MANVNVSASYIGYDGSRSIYRVDLSSLGLSSVRSFAIVDDGFKTGGVGGASGFDIDFLKISTNGAAAANTVKNLVGENLFDFQNSVGFQPGYLTPWTVDRNPIWNTPYLFGTDPGNVYNPAKATLGVADGDLDASVGSLSFGEGGIGTFVLTSAITTSTPYYLYIAEYGDQYQGVDGIKVVVSSDASIPISNQNLTLYGTPGVDTFSFGQGINAHIGHGNDYINGLESNDWILASSGNDTVIGGSGNDVLYGETGNDWIFGDGGFDFINGGSGNDVVYGGVDNDLIYGDIGNDYLFGQDGRDFIVGGAGHDKLYGGNGNDKLYGGAGKDKFFFNTKPHKSQNVDHIYDFKPKDDSIYLENFYFKVGKGNASKPLKINADVFTIGKVAADAEDRIIYNKDNGALYYDPDGTGAKAMIKITLLGKDLKLTYHDFFVI